jgi:flagellar hook-basal body protein
VGNSLEQQVDANQGALPNPDAAALGNDPSAVNPNNWTQPMVGAAVNLAAVQAAPAGTFVWDQQPPENPAHQVVETVYDSEGNPRQVTVNFYQVNDLGAGGINNPAGPNQVAYAWYAFDTTGGQQPTTANLVGGTGIFEGDLTGAADGYNRGEAGAEFAGDLVVFNTDGSLLSTGGDQIAGLGAGEMSMPDIYLPPLNINGAVPTAPVPVGGNNGPGAPASPLPTLGAQITQITLNFGTAGILGQGRRDGLYSDAEGSYQVINGVNTYVPNSTAIVKSQNGNPEGVLSSVNFDATGTIQGTFSLVNGLTSTVAIGQVVLAMPNNQGGLTDVGNGYYQQSSNSGAMFVGFAGQDGVGTIQGDTLELSNVDLTTELSNMIIAQRGFDVNSRVIAVENSNLQILSQLGQGG